MISPVTAHGLNDHGSSDLTANWWQTISSVISYELAFVLFLNMGLLKKYPLLEPLQSEVDLTVLAALFTIIIGLFVALRRGLSVPRKNIITSLIFCALFGFVALSVVWSTGGPFSVTKGLWMPPLVLLSFLGSTLIISVERARVQRFLVLTLIFSFWVAFITFIAVQNRGGYASGSIEIAEASDYIMRGNSMAVGFVILFGSALFYGKGTVRLILHLSGMLILLAGILVTGSKQSLMGVLVVVIATFIAKSLYGSGQGLVLNSKLLLQVLSLAACAVVLIMVLDRMQVEMATMERATNAITGENNLSAEGRLQYYQDVFESFGEAPVFGHGAGSFGIRYGLESTRDHPHNIIFDFAYDLGLVGVLLFLTLVFYSFKGFVRVTDFRNDQIVFTIFWLLVGVYGVTGMVSSSYAEDRMLFSFLGLMCTIPNSKKLAEGLSRQFWRGWQDREFYVRPGLRPSI